MDSDAGTKGTRDIEIENNKIRDHLKDLNDQLSKIIERAKVANLVPKRVEFRLKNDEDKLRTTLKEISNNEKILDFTVTEYNSIKTRLDQIKDPGYTFDIEEKIADTKSKLSDNKRAIKGLKLNTGNVGRDLDDIDKADGVAPMIQEANTKGKELAALRRKLQKVREMNNNFDEEKETKNTKLETVNEQYRSLQVRAEAYKVFTEESKYATRYQELKTQAKNLEEHIRISTNNNEKYLKNQLERNIEELYINKAKETEALERLENMIEEQRVVLKEMLENEDYRTDRATMDIINKIKISLDENNKLTLERPSFSVMSDQPKSKGTKPPLSLAKKPQDVYSGLPLYSPPNVKVDSLLKKKDIIKKEMNALREQAREENQRSLTPEPRKQKLDSEGSSPKPNIVPKSKKNWKADVEEEPVSEPQQAQQERNRDSDVKLPEKKKADDDENEGGLSLPAAFSKPNLFKKSGAKPEPELKAPSLSIPGSVTNANTNKLELGPSLNLAKKDQPLLIPGQEPVKKEEPLKLVIGQTDNKKLDLGFGKKADEPLGLQESERGGLFLTNPGVVGRNRKEEPLSLNIGGQTEQKPLGLNTNEGLTLGGNFAQQKKPLNQELTIGGNSAQLKKPANQELSLDGGFGQPKKPLEVVEEPKPVVKPKVDDSEETFNIGGLSRLNRLKRGAGGAGAPTSNVANNTIPEVKDTLELTGFPKPAANTNAQPLTLNNNQELKLEFGSNAKKPDNQSVFNYQPDSNKAKNQLDDDLFGGIKPNNGLGLNKGPSNPNNGGLFLDNNAFGKKEEQAPRGRDRSHLASNEKKDDEDLFGSKKAVQNNNAVVKPSSTFDPDDIFASKEKSDKKPEAVGLGFGAGAGAGAGPTNTNALSDNNSGLTIPGARLGRGGIGGRPKQVSAFDSEDIFDSSPNKNVNAAPKEEAFGGLNLGGGFGFGNKGAGAGFGFGGGNVNTNANTNTNSITNINAPITNTNPSVQEIGAGPKRMRMNDLKQKGDNIKEKVQQKFILLLNLCLGEEPCNKS